jgi:hypothetical protein
VECAGLGGVQEEAFVGHGGALARATGPDEATAGSAKPLPLILLAFCQTPDHPRPPRAATHCQSFVSRLSPLAVRTRNSGASRLEDDKRFCDPIAQFVDEVSNRLTECGSHSGRESNQDDSGRLLSAGVREQAEILVFGQEDAIPNGPVQGRLRPQHQD